MPVAGTKSDKRPPFSGKASKSAPRFAPNTAGCSTAPQHSSARSETGSDRSIIVGLGWLGHARWSAQWSNNSFVPSQAQLIAQQALTQKRQTVRLSRKGRRARRRRSWRRGCKSGQFRPFEFPVFLCGNDSEVPRAVRRHIELRIGNLEVRIEEPQPAPA